ncbi:nucleobase-ascorbate transporter 3-like isoform X2 [Malus domestica]|uniref:nucleobase-ascorbate transporter 3-like isoform X2 n=1 Tax=Malus domestica TaxID=3750 RepID=UPI000498823C|nr:nucleobase-ascorbate transporter 3-like isoform X2 [Malus domestica]XP_028950473.1 nucleobase-ascorbate transporter 3-like isoform X2 [Malus domestica]XP_028950474.1 nucleobase-ascorbate transporter 3-like isoform X2 [Malus domestica]XP_028950476.1 nucleobase-ascorbate transporter 3-like isoform X2 [Malus domestica]
MIQKFLGTWLPTVMTASFAFTLPVLSIINDYSDRNFRSEHEGVGMLLEGIFGGAVGTTASVEVWRFLCIDSFADICCHVLCFIWNSAVGITFIQFANNNSLRNIYVLGLSLFLGISIPQYFVSNSSPNGVGPVKTDGGWFDDILNTIFSSSPTMAIIVGTLLDNTLDAKYAVDNRGLAWWRPFQSRKGDVRNEEFYSLPVRIREYIPTRFLY